MKQNYILPTIYKETTNDSITASKINNIHELYDYLKCEYNINIDMCYNQKILYISDLHIETITSILGINAFVKKLKKETLKNCLIDSYSNIFIAGDISREFNYFKAFIKALKKYFKRNNIFIVLGNHELSIEKSEIKNIYDKYKKELNKYKRINLLQNELVGITQNSEFRIFKRFSEINNKVREEYDYFIFGGTGFAGFNEEWNANNLIYGKLEINRAKEISESKAFSESINKVNDILKSKNLIILSHFPIQDCLEIKPHNNVNYYINGHTHRNYMKRLDNNNIIYCNNQLGYYSNRKNKVFFKYFSFDKKFDYLDYLNDGIHNISSTSYKKFLRFKSIHTSKTFSKNEQLYCLKRNNYYLFILKTSKSLCILNKGAKKKLPNKPLEYFYENMNKVIKTIKTPYDKYYELQKKISKEVK
ncbi:MAG: metallophosphoesterase, partial [Lachnospiraceae bacterium]|nr:metallophosphoesterase [Lachnospiraceae bacterium]